MSETHKLPGVIEAAIEAHGGATHWNQLIAVEATISARGFLFAAKHRPVMQRVRVRAATREVRFVFHDFPRAGETAELIGGDEVRIAGHDGTVLARRGRPRAAFRSWRRQIYWDSLDFVYFGGYATWNYFVAPFIFLRSGFTFEELPPLATPTGPWSKIRATFPAEIPTHSRVQDFYFDQQHRLRRLDYTAEVVGRWTRAAHTCEDEREFNGLLIPTRRTVRPLPFGNEPLPFPTLVALEIHDFRTVN